MFSKIPTISVTIVFSKSTSINYMRSFKSYSKIISLFCFYIYITAHHNVRINSVAVSTTLLKTEHFLRIHH